MRRPAARLPAAAGGRLPPAEREACAAFCVTSHFWAPPSREFVTNPLIRQAPIAGFVLSGLN
ncbi:hypothetical protein WS68_17340 [Burkholderia sp. TSV86]|nr:hypothetical protein WS68_17340 [Burkholderia sp. TSV86]